MQELTGGGRVLGPENIGMHSMLVDMARYMTEREKNVFDVFDVFRI